MDQWKKPESFFPTDSSGDRCLASNRLPIPCADPSQKVEHEVMDSITARKIQKADREKLRRDRLNEQFLELGKALDPDRPKNDKATILTDTIQILTDLTAQVKRLKTEYTSLSEESVELTQEKNELRAEKSTLKSDIDNLNAQYQQRLRFMYPWATMDPSVVTGPPAPYPFPMPVSVTSGPIPIHPSVQSYPFFQNQSPGVMFNPCPAYVPYSSHLNPQVEQSSTQHILPHPSSNRSQAACRQDSRSKSSDRQQHSGAERNHDYNDVVTDLELKTPGSASSSHSRAASDLGGDGLNVTESISPSASGSPESSSYSTGDGPVADT